MWPEEETGIITVYGSVFMESYSYKCQGSGGLREDTDKLSSFTKGSSFSEVKQNVGS